MRFMILLLLGALPAIVQAQSSGSYRLDEGAFHAGGRSEQRRISGSESFRITLDSLGGPFAARELAAASFRMGTSFIQGILPPGDVEGLRWLTPAHLAWDADPAAADYNVYRDPLTELPGTHGTCLAMDVGGTAYHEAVSPVLGAGFFYLVTSRNRLTEEGPRGVQSDGTARSNQNACP